MSHASALSMCLDPKRRLFNFDREPLGLLPESLKSTIELNDQRAIATLHAPRWRSPPEQTPLEVGPWPLARLIRAYRRLMR